MNIVLQQEAAIAPASPPPQATSAAPASPPPQATIAAPASPQATSAAPAVQAALVKHIWKEYILSPMVLCIISLIIGVSMGIGVIIGRNLNQ